MAEAKEDVEDKKRVRPDILQAALLDEIAGRLLEIQDSMLEERPEGITEPIEPVAVTDAQRFVLAPFEPWFSVMITNDGPDSVWAVVNSEKSITPHLIRIGEVYQVAVKTSILKDVLLYCNEHETASVRVVGVR